MTTHRNDYSIRPVGYIESPFDKPPGSSKSGADPVQRKKEVKAVKQEIRYTTSRIHILPKYAPLIDGLEGFSHIIVLFWPHLLGEADRQKQKVHPRGWKDLPQQGIFATRSPARPNPILITTVALTGVEGRVLRVKGLEALNDTPVIDIKPVITATDKLENFRVPEWVRTIHD